MTQALISTTHSLASQTALNAWLNTFDNLAACLTDKAGERTFANRDIMSAETKGVRMTIFDKAIAEVSNLPPKERNDFARFILAELKDERLWAKQFARSQDQLAQLADEALADYHAGKTEPMDLRRR